MDDRADTRLECDRQSAAEAELRAKLASGEWIEMGRYYSPHGCCWVTVFDTPEGCAAFRELAPRPYPSWQWAEEYGDARRITANEARKDP